MKEDNDLEEIEFDWDEYLKQTSSEAAPKSCFRQHETPPVNEFVIGQKLETVDPRNRSSMCIATVIDTCGSRIRLRLDGTDDRNDFWLLVDSEFIHPFEYTTKNGGTIQPPLGFRNNLSTWPRFFDKIVQSAQENTFAGEKCFKTPPAKPPKNEFKKGQKLEAIDQKNPHLICPATITEVDKDNLHISFDGWSQSCSFWCSYASRDIFPIGWCKVSKHPLQHPGHYEDARRRPNRRSASNSLNVSGKLNDSIKQQQQPSQLNESMIKTDPHESSMTSRPASPVVQTVITNGTNTTPNNNTITNSNTLTTPAPAPTNNATNSNAILPSSNDNTSTPIASNYTPPPPPTPTPIATTTTTNIVNGTASTNGTNTKPPPTTDSKEKLTETTTPLKQNKTATNQTKTSTKIDLNIVKTEPITNNEPAIQTSNESSSKTNTKNDTNNSEHTLNASKKENVSVDQVYVYINPKVDCGEYLNTEKFHKNYKKYGPEIPKNLFKMVLQSFIDCAHDSSKIFDLIQDGDSTSYIKFKASNRNERKHLPKIENEAQLWTNLNLMCKSFNISENLFYKTPTNTAISTKKDSSITNQNNNSHKPLKRNDDNSTNNRNGHKSPDKPVTNQKSLKRRSSSTESYKNQKMLKTEISNNPSTWDVNQVGNYVLQADPNLASHVETLKYQEIDGKALLLLTTDVMMKYMGLKLGPAIKLNNIIERLRKR